MEQWNSQYILDEARRVLQEEAEALRTLELGADFSLAVKTLDTSLSQGKKIILSGVGKSGDVAKKVAATLRSTGSMAVYVHPVEALHGDLGLFSSEDAFLYFSHSGSTMELLQLCPLFPQFNLFVVGVLGNKNGKLAKYSQCVIPAPILREACPHNLAPTTSSTLQMAIGDAISICLQKMAGFSKEKYGHLHPGGMLGKRLHARVKDLMHSKDRTIMLSLDSPMEKVVLSMTEARMGGVCVVDARGKLLGVITERDIRHAILKREIFFQLQAKNIMTKDPLTVFPETSVQDALEFLEAREYQVSFLPVVDKDTLCVGVIRIHDLVSGVLC